ncbi:putative SP-containing membrane protein [Vairimorpha necatrix]|uniref:SP-containing membrane protein n=1 Tax=Vairimorpha necatrix TaxID=6039 RepID=A0AAX4JDP9_9MICR
MIFPLINLLGIFCGDYAFIDPKDDKYSNVYMSLNNLETVENLEITIISKRYNKKEIEGIIYYFETLNIKEQEDLITSLEEFDFRNDEELEMIKNFYDNKFILKTTVDRKKENVNRVRGLFISIDPKKSFYKTSPIYMFNDEKNIQELDFRFLCNSNSQDCEEKITTLALDNLFTVEDFKWKVKKQPLVFQPIKNESINARNDEPIQKKAIMVRDYDKEDKINDNLLSENITGNKQVQKKILKKDINNKNPNKSELAKNNPNSTNNGDQDKDQSFTSNNNKPKSKKDENNENAKKSNPEHDDSDCNTNFLQFYK